MIAHLSGTVARTDQSSVVVDVHGVGYRVLVPSSLLSELPAQGEPITLYTLMTVREDDISLYGFRTLAEQQVFVLMTSVTGVGPKVALSILGSLDVSDLARAIATNDIRTLTRSPGVGTKLAQRVILELGERMAEVAFERKVDELAAHGKSTRPEMLDDIVGALVNWGYSRADSRRAADRALANAQDASDTPLLVREALRLLTSDR